MDESTVRFFQYVADDRSQLDSNVVRAFQETHDAQESPDLQRIASGEVHFHAHVFLATGVEQGFWRKIGHAKPPSKVGVLFRDSNDYGDPAVKVSRDWYVWKTSSRFKDVGELKPRYQEAEIGVVVPPESLVHRMRNGRYDFIYPDF